MYYGLNQNLSGEKGNATLKTRYCLSEKRAHQDDMTWDHYYKM